GIVLGDQSGSLDLNDFEDDDDEAVTATERRRRATVAVEELGKEVAGDEVALATLLPELIRGSGKLGEFGRGLALGEKEPRALWDQLVAEVAKQENPNVQLLLGFLSGLEAKDAAGANALLDEAID